MKLQNLLVQKTVCAARGATPEAKEKFMKTWNSYNDFILKEATDDLSESQPTAGNIAGGLTTIEEKAFGNFQKIGNLNFIDVLEPAEEPKKGKGIIFYGHFFCRSRMYNPPSSWWF